MLGCGLIASTQLLVNMVICPCLIISLFSPISMERSVLTQECCNEVDDSNFCVMQVFTFCEWLVM